MKNHGEFFNVAHIENDSLIYGPGKRFVVWFQGCSLACKGCWNTQMWSFKENQLIRREHLLKQIMETSDIHGISLLGGEPLQQADNLWWLLEQIRLHSNLSVFLYTGFEAKEIQELGFENRIDNLCDIVAMGRYDEKHRNINQQWIGSDNQQIIYPRNSRDVAIAAPLNQVEIIIDEKGGVTTLGFPDDGLIGHP